MKRQPLRVAFGPAAPQFGSWRWLGADLSDALKSSFEATEFSTSIPDLDVVIFIKFKPPADVMRSLRPRTLLVYCPVDIYGSVAEIEADAPALTSCDLIIVNCDRLERYFTAFSDVKYLDHPIKYSVTPSSARVTDGPIVWIGNRANLQPVVEWVNHHDLTSELWVLTDIGDESQYPSASDIGFTSRNRVRLETWTCEKHLTWLRLARGALDVKGWDFRARHKPPAKALDFVASGLPLAMTLGSTASDRLKKIGFELASPDDPDYWFSQEYWNATQVAGEILRRDLSLHQIASQVVDLINSTMAILEHH